MKSIIYIKGKSVDDVKSTVSSLLDTRPTKEEEESPQPQQHPQPRMLSVRFKVRTNLPVVELAVRNFNQVLSLSMPPPTPTFPKSPNGGGTTTTNLNKSGSNSSISSSSTSNRGIDDDLSSVWLIHSNGTYSPAKIFAKIIHKSPNDTPNIIK